MKKLLFALCLVCSILVIADTLADFKGAFASKNYQRVIEIFDGNPGDIKINVENLFIYISSKIFIDKDQWTIDKVQTELAKYELKDADKWLTISKVFYACKDKLIINEAVLNKGRECIDKDYGPTLIITYGLKVDALVAYNLLKDRSNVDLNRYIMICKKVNKYEGLAIKFDFSIPIMSPYNVRRNLELILDKCTEDEPKNCFVLANRKCSKNLINKKEEWTPVITYIRTILETF